MPDKLREKLLPVFDKVARGIPNKLGLRQYDIALRVISWSGARPGLGTKTVTNYAITVNQNIAGNNRPKVKLLSSREVVASGGKYVEGDYRIGPLTPQYTKNAVAYGTLPSDLERALTANPQEVYFNLKGPGMSDATNGDWFTLVETDFTRNFGYSIVIRKSGKVPS